MSRKLFCLRSSQVIGMAGAPMESIKPRAIIEAESELDALNIALARGLISETQRQNAIFARHPTTDAPPISEREAEQAHWIKMRIYKDASK